MIDRMIHKISSNAMVSGGEVRSHLSGCNILICHNLSMSLYSFQTHTCTCMERDWIT